MAMETFDPKMVIRRFGLAGPTFDASAPAVLSLYAQMLRRNDVTIPGDDLFSTREIMIGLRRAADLDRAAATGKPAPAAPTGVADGGRMLEPIRGKNGNHHGPTAQALFLAEASARFDHAAATGVPLLERLVMFWSNHFCVAVDKNNQVKALAGVFEREAIRPHVLGRFEDMLTAVETHPAMLIFLDNVQSVGPNSEVGRKTGAGINENLAREILELHTLGVDGGYDQADVRSLSMMITGWTYFFDDKGGVADAGYRFEPRRHEPGDKTLLGRTFADDGAGQGLAALRHLANHPSTARFVATKLVRAFVSEEPQPRLVEELARVFKASGGDLAAVTRTLIDAPENRRPMVKVRSPYEFVISAARVLRPRVATAELLGALEAMGEPLWRPGGPNGHPDTTRVWLSPQSMMMRLDTAVMMARKAPALRLRELASGGGLAGVVDTATATAIANARSDEEATVAYLMSPEFQRR